MNLETAKEIHSSFIWEEICKEIDSRITGYLSKLRSCSPDQLREIQCKIECLEEVKRLPQDVIDREE